MEASFRPGIPLRPGRHQRQCPKRHLDLDQLRRALERDRELARRAGRHRQPLHRLFQRSGHHHRPDRVASGFAQAIGTLVFGDLNTSTAAGWLIDNNSNALNILTLAGQTNILVNALGAGKQVTISANLAGTSGLRKTGAGTLDLNSANLLTGGVAVNQGTLTLDYSAGATVLGSQALALGGGALTVQGYSNAPVTQSFTSTLLNAGQNIITAVNGAGTNTNDRHGRLGQPSGRRHCGIHRAGDDHQRLDAGRKRRGAGNGNQQRGDHHHDGHGQSSVR